MFLAGVAEMAQADLVGQARAGRHQLRQPGLQVDEVLSFGPRQQATRMEVVEDERRKEKEEMPQNGE